VSPKTHWLEATKKRLADRRISEQNILIDDIFDCITVKFPVGAVLFLVGPEPADGLLDIEFEKYQFLAEYQAALYCQSDRWLEVGVVGMGRNMHPKAAERSLMRFPNYQNGQITLAKDSQEIVIGPVSQTYQTFARCLPRFGTRPVSISMRISNAPVTNATEAADWLQKIIDSLLVQIELIAPDLPPFWAVERRQGPARIRTSRPEPLDKALEFPRFQYEKNPVELYRYARSAIGMPLLQFLAYYQILEHFFSRFSREAAIARVKGILKNPAFRSTDRDIEGILTVVSDKAARGGYGDEREQLKATIRSCTFDGELERFLHAAPPSRARHFGFEADKSMKFHFRHGRLFGKGSDTELSEGELCNRVGLLLYEIRCQIVHTKADDQGSGGFLVPFSEVANNLSHEIELVRFIAQRVMIATGIPLA
jgi:hypothetical protein